LLPIAGSQFFRQLLPIRVIIVASFSDRTF
jgi:hypothetical protein